MWIVHPSSLPRDLPKRLQKRGFKEVELMPGMARSLFNLPEIPSLPDGMEIRKVLEEGDASEYYSFASWRWSVPEEFNQQLSATLAGFQLGKPETKAHAWQVWHNGQPVAKAGAFFTIGSVGVYGVATKPEARRLGLGSILTLTVLEFAQLVGKNLAILHSSPMAESLYSSLGFEAIANFHIYAPEYVNNFFG